MNGRRLEQPSRDSGMVKVSRPDSGTQVGVTASPLPVMARFLSRSGYWQGPVGSVRQIGRQGRVAPKAGGGEGGT